MKKCCSCNKKKKISKNNFYQRKSGSRVGEFYATCIKCLRKRGKKYYKEFYKKEYLKHNKKRRRRNQDFINAIKTSNPCVDCGIKYSSHIMDFDHIDNKFKNVSAMVNNGYSIKTILEEISKCELVCSNCHRERTHKRKFGDYG